TGEMFPSFLGTAVILFIIQLQCNAFSDHDCSDEWINLKTKCFKFVKEPKNSKEAISHCHQIGSELTNEKDIRDDTSTINHATIHFEIDTFWVVGNAETASETETTTPRTKVSPAAGGVIDCDASVKIDLRGVNKTTQYCIHHKLERTVQKSLQNETMTSETFNMNVESVVEKFVHVLNGGHLANNLNLIFKTTDLIGQLTKKYQMTEKTYLKFIELTDQVISSDTKVWTELNDLDHKSSRSFLRGLDLISANILKSNETLQEIIIKNNIAVERNFIGENITFPNESFKNINRSTENFKGNKLFLSRQALRNPFDHQRYFIYVIRNGHGRFRIGEKVTKLASSANGKLGLFSKQQGWPLQQTARLASSANGKVGLFSKQWGWPLQQTVTSASSANSKVDLFSKRQGWPLQQTAKLASSASSGVGHFSKQKKLSKFQEDSVSDILSLSIDGRDGRLAGVITLEFHIEEKNTSKPSCIYLVTKQSSEPFWSDSGCYEVSRDDSTVVCQCNHLTNFAVLMSTSQIYQYELNIISLVGCVLSIVCLVVTIAVYLLLWKFLRSEKSILLMNLCVCLAAGYVIFLAGINRTENKVVCKVIALFLHYIFLTVFFNFLSQSIALNVAITNMTSKKYTKHYLILSYSPPAIIVVLTLAITKTEGFGEDYYCWLSPESGVIWSFAGPAITVVAVNIAVLLNVVRIIQSSVSMMDENMSSRSKSFLRTLLILTPLFGLTWVFGVLSLSGDSLVFQYLFAVLNSLQVREGFRNWRRSTHSSSSNKTLFTEGKL
ncbi:Adhesion G protein-coupled receptor L1, partial [Bulinus truncatus]